MKLWSAAIIAVVVALALFAAAYLFGRHPQGQRAGAFSSVEWQRMAEPGRLSRAHEFLEHNCAACHTSVKGVQAANCIACHANDQALLQRQPTAFHATVQSCVECHVEHQGLGVRPTGMDHAALASLSLRQLGTSSTTQPGNAGSRDRIIGWIDQHQGNAALPSGHPTATPAEAALGCAACHSNQDRHRGLFGTNCVQCHTTTAWTVPAFRHPPPTSTSCAQCHQAPPSHYMMHFQMVSMMVAHQPHAQVNQCFLCHQTNDWNDIKGVGWYKHH
jgi:hypothetical protein